MDRVLIDALISCPKRIKVPPKKQMTMDPRNNFTFRNDFTCVSEDEKTFEVFCVITRSSHSFFLLVCAIKANMELSLSADTMANTRTGTKLQTILLLMISMSTNCMIYSCLMIQQQYWTLMLQINT